jgi:outer membrane protein assembly factor BamB
MRKIICLLLISMFIIPAFAADWSMYKNDLSHSGYTGDTVKPPLNLKWTKDLGSETDSSPVIVGEVLYIGSSFGIHALDIRSGQELWKYRTNGFVKSVPTVVNGILYVGGDDKQFYAIDTGNGTLKWVNKKVLQGFTSSPSIVDNVIYAIPKDGTFYAFDINNGEIIWSKLIGKIVESSPAAGEGIITFGTDGGLIVALDPATGKEKWHYDAGANDFKSSPLISNGTVFIGSNDGSMYALSTDKGTFKWKYSTSGNIESSPSIRNGVIYFGSKDSNFYAVDAVTGKLKWEFSNSGPVVSTPAISNDVVYFGTTSNFIYALDANSGQLLWRNSTGKKDTDYITSPALSGNMLFTATHKGVVYAYSSQTQAAIAETTSTVTVHETQVIPINISPTSSTQETKKSPGFESPVLIFLIMAIFGIYLKKK